MTQTEDVSTGSVINQSGGIDIAADHVAIGGDVVGRDKITIYQVASRPEIPSPPEPTRLPETPGFVGRETELTYFADQLTCRHLAVICGMPGVGKTALAAVLARRTHDPDRTFWHEFHQDESVTTILWKLAAFLARHGQVDLWQMLNSAQQTGGQAQPTAVLVDYLFQMVRNQNYLLCLDNFEFVVDDPALEQIGTRMRPALAAGELSVIITSQRIPQFVQVDEFQPLAGLSLEDTGSFLVQRGIKLQQDQTQPAPTVYDSLALAGMEHIYSADIVANLYTRTEGNALFLTFAADRLIHTSNPARFLTRLFADDDIERFLMKEIDSRLTDNERAVMNTIAVLLGYPGTRAAIEAVLDGENVRRELNHLSERHFVQVAENEHGREFSLNGIVRAFYYDALSKRERQPMHRRAGAFYETEELDPIRAALHFEAAGEVQRATELATSNVELAINRGQARLLHRLLGRLAEAQLNPAGRAAVSEARGDLHYLLGELDDAQRQFEQALTLGTSPERITQARHHRKLGEVLYRKSNFEGALKQLSTGCELLTGLDQTDGILEDAHIVIMEASVLIVLNRYDEAIAQAQGALDHLQAASVTEPRVAASLHDLIGKSQFFTGDFAKSLEHFSSAFQLRHGVNELQGMIKSLSNLAVVYGKQNRYADALLANQSAVNIAEQISDIVGLSLLYNNIAADFFDQGIYDRALEYYERSLKLCEKMGDLRGVSRAYENLGEVYGRLHLFANAEDYLTRAIKLAEQISIERTVIGATEALAGIRLAQGRVEEALAHCQASLERADRSHNQYWRPSSLDLLGRIYHRLGRWDEARACFDEACRLWLERGADLDRATTLLNWAALERDANQINRARELSVEAIRVATQHRSEGVLKQAETLLAELPTTTDSQGGETDERSSN